MLHLAAGHGDKAVVELMLNQSGVDIRKMLFAENNAVRFWCWREMQ